MAVIYSNNQKHIFKIYNTTKNNLLINAGPGSGKSFTMLELAKQTPKYRRSIFLSFNKSIAEENQKKLPDHIFSKTLHSLGFHCLFLNIPNFHPMLNEIKTFILARKQLKLLPSEKRTEKQKNKYLFDLAKIYDLWRMNLCTGKDEIENLCENYDLPLTETTIEDFWSLLEIMKQNDKKILNGEDGMIDYTDMIWLNHYFEKDKFPKYDIVFCDEVQDLNPLQKLLFDNVKKDNGRFVCVGDRRQTIYSFSGASLKFFDSLTEVPNTIECDLDISYRCSKAVVEEANKIFPNQRLVSFEKNSEGEVRDGELKEVQDGDFVLCRNNRPLVESFIKLLKENKKATIYGKDYGDALLDVLTECDTENDKAVFAYFEEKLLKIKEMLINRGVTKPFSHPLYVNFLEKVQILMILHQEFLSYKKVKELIKTLFTDKIEGITLMTIHKSKGLEAKNVFFLYPQLIPSQYATSCQMLYSEKCLSYVAITRAKEKLIYIR